MRKIYISTQLITFEVTNFCVSLPFFIFILHPLGCYIIQKLILTSLFSSSSWHIKTVISIIKFFLRNHEVMTFIVSCKTFWRTHIRSNKFAEQIRNTKILKCNVKRREI